MGLHFAAPFGLMAFAIVVGLVAVGMTVVAVAQHLQERADERARQPLHGSPPLPPPTRPALWLQDADEDLFQWPGRPPAPLRQQRKEG